MKIEVSFLKKEEFDTVQQSQSPFKTKNLSWEGFSINLEKEKTQ